MTALMKDQTVRIEDLLYGEIPEVMLDPTRRHDCMFLFDVENGNPNGDPDAENAPRTEGIHGYGLVTDGCFKRKIRDFWNIYAGMENFIQPSIPLNNHIQDAVIKAGGTLAQMTLSESDDETVADVLAHIEGLDDFTVEGSTITYTGTQAKKSDIEKALKADLPNTSPLIKAIRDLKIAAHLEAGLSGKKGGISQEIRTAAEAEMVKRFMDVRMFGALMTTGVNAGQRRGPVQVVPSSSIDPIFPQELAITRQAKTTAERLAKSRTEIGRRQMVSYALYRGHMFYNAPLGIRNDVTEADMRLLWEAMMRMFSLDHAAGRAMMRMRGVFVWSHKSQYGEAPYDKLFEQVRVTNTGPQFPRSFDDYRVDVTELEKNDRVTFTRLVG